MELESRGRVGGSHLEAGQGPLPLEGDDPILISREPGADTTIELHPKTPLPPPIASFLYEAVTRGFDQVVLSRLREGEGPILVMTEPGERFSADVLGQLSEATGSQIVVTRRLNASADQT